MTPAQHHMDKILYYGQWRPARPARDTSWWRRVLTEFNCGRRTGHCWHLESSCWIDHWCCMCSADMDGSPLNRCVYCT